MKWTSFLYLENSANYELQFWYVAINYGTIIKWFYRIASINKSEIWRKPSIFHIMGQIMSFFFLIQKILYDLICLASQWNEVTVQSVKSRHQYLRFFKKELSISRFQSWDQSQMKALVNLHTIGVFFNFQIHLFFWKITVFWNSML